MILRPLFTLTHCIHVVVLLLRSVVQLRPPHTGHSHECSAGAAAQHDSISGKSAHWRRLLEKSSTAALQLQMSIPKENEMLEDPSILRCLLDRCVLVNLITDLRN